MFLARGLGVMYLIGPFDQRMKLNMHSAAIRMPTSLDLEIDKRELLPLLDALLFLA